MKAIERKSMWHHVAFSAVLCAAMTCLVIIKHDAPGIWVVLLIATYIAGNTWLHVKRRDFRTETLYEYLLVSAAVLIVLLGAFKH